RHTRFSRDWSSDVCSSDLEFRVVGGDRMERASETSALIHVSQMAFMGFVEVIANLQTITKNLRRVKADMVAYAPDTLVLIDFPRSEERRVGKESRSRWEAE